MRLYNLGLVMFTMVAMIAIVFSGTAYQLGKQDNARVIATLERESTFIQDYVYHLTDSQRREFMEELNALGFTTAMAFELFGNSIEASHERIKTGVTEQIEQARNDSSQEINQEVKAVDEQIGSINTQLKDNEDGVKRIQGQLNDSIESGLANVKSLKEVIDEDVHALQKDVTSLENRDDFLAHTLKKSLLDTRKLAPKGKAAFFEIFDGKSSVGSGWLYGQKGIHVFTNFHVVDSILPEDLKVKALSDGTIVSAKVLGKDENRDIALLLLEKAVPSSRPLSLASGQPLRPAQRVFTMGNPFGAFPGTIDVGIISNPKPLSYCPNGNQSCMAVIQLNIPVNLGNSGGMVLNLDAEVVAMTTASFPGENLPLAQQSPVTPFHIAMPARYMQELADSLRVK